jgi:CheY-like chemotaxis protein
MGIFTNFIQMPLVDGSEATRLIRNFENSTSPSLSDHAKSYGRIPIFAVSASLTERYRDEYVDTGFDGWILKPIDFKRLEAMLAAIRDENLRGGMLYVKGSWDKGGWFTLHGEGIGN